VPSYLAIPSSVEVTNTPPTRNALAGRL
jgi:hypothetical protein